MPPIQRSPGTVRVDALPGHRTRPDRNDRVFGNTPVRRRPRGSRLRAQSVPKRSGTSCLLVARRGTNAAGQMAYQSSDQPFVRTDNAEADGSIPSSPTKGLMNGYFWSCEYKHLNAEVGGPGLK